MIKLHGLISDSVEAILAYFKLLLGGRSANMDLNLHLFNDCTGSGYVIDIQKIDGADVDNGIHYAFAKYEYSDKLVVYRGIGLYDPNSISPKCWESSQFFEISEFTQAAEYILQGLLEYYEKEVNEVKKEN